MKGRVRAKGQGRGVHVHVVVLVVLLDLFGRVEFCARGGGGDGGGEVFGFGNHREGW